MRTRFSSVWSAGLALALMGCQAGGVAGEGSAEEHDVTVQELESGSADWAQYGRTARRTSYNPLESTLDVSNVANLTTAWTCCASGRPRNAIALWNDRLFVTNTRIETDEQEDGVGYAYVLRALDPATGALLWQAPRPAYFETFTSDLAVGYGRIHAQHVDYSPLISASTGRYLGDAGLGPGFDDPIAPPLLKGRTVVSEVAGAYQPEVGGYVLTIRARHADTAAWLWSRRLGDSWTSPRTPAFASERVFTVLDDENRLLALDATTGEDVWMSEPAAGQLGSPAIYGGRVFVLSRPNTVNAYDERTGALLWQTPFTGETPTGTPLRAPVVGPDAVYATLNKTSGGVAVGAFDAVTGRRRWGLIVGDEVQTSNIAALANGVLYIGTSSGRLFALDASDGATLGDWQFSAGISGLIVANGRVHLATGAQGVHTLALPVAPTP